MTAARQPVEWLPLRQLLLYTGAGAVGTAVHYAALALLVELGGVPPGAAAAAGAALGALTNYALNYRLTFRSRAAHIVTLPRFLAVAVAGIVISGVIVDLGTRGLGVHYIAAQVVATAVVLIAGFVANRLWTFRATAVTPPAIRQDSPGRGER